MNSCQLLFTFFAFSLLSLLFVCLLYFIVYICMHVYIFFFVFCYHKLVNKDLYINEVRDLYFVLIGRSHGELRRFTAHSVRSGEIRSSTLP